MRKTVLSVVLYVLAAVGYFSTAQLSYAFSIKPSGMVGLWLPSGLLLAALLLLEKRHWAVALAGAFSGCVLADLRNHNSLAFSLAAAFANCLETGVAAWFLVRIRRTSAAMESLRDVLALVLEAAIFSNGLTALAGAAVLTCFSSFSFVKAWFVWWMADGVGMLIVAPVVLVWAAHGWPPRLNRWRMLEAGLLFISLVAFGQLVLGGAPVSGRWLNPYMAFPFLVWAALRFGPTGAASAVFVLACVASWNLVKGTGPFTLSPLPMNRALQAYAYFVLASVSSLIPAAVLRERKTAEDRVRDSEERLRLLLDSTAEGIFGLDLEGRCTFCNSACLRYLGLENANEPLGRKIHDIIHHHHNDGTDYSLETCRLRAALDGGKLVHADDEVFWRADGTSFPAEYWSHPIRRQGAIIGAVVAFLDITQKQKLSEELRQAQKMEAVGRLAGGVAHDFNNILMIISGYSELLLETTSDDQLRHAASQIGQAADRAASLTRQLLAFGRKQTLEPRVLNLNQVLANLQGMLRRLIREDIDLVTVLEPNLGQVQADPSQIEQVLMNLAVNARDAMPQGGRLVIETANVELDEAYCRGHAGMRPGSHVIAAVSDNGKGMDAETQSHIFEPFFTTKELGKGTGLGLATVYGIVKQSGGYIGVQSEPGRGSTFEIYLPRVEAPAEEDRQRPATASTGGTETILLVEDDQRVREVAGAILRRKGYTVLDASDGTAALQIAKQYGQHIHLLMTDMVMPHISGAELAQRLARMRPEIKVLFMSGYAEDVIACHGLPESAAAFLPIPFTAEALAQKLRELFR
jgi:PAS domain S-box-containing protein